MQHGIDAVTLLQTIYLLFILIIEMRNNLYNFNVIG